MTDDKINTGSIDTAKRSTFVEPAEETAPEMGKPRAAKIPEFLEESTLAERKAAAQDVKDPTPELRKASVAPPVKARDASIAQASQLINRDRDEEYGAAQLSFERISDIWTAILGTRVTEKQVALMMAGLKIARLSYDPDSEDGWVDLIGYAALGSEVLETGIERHTLTGK